MPVRYRKVDSMQAFSGAVLIILGSIVVYGLVVMAEFAVESAQMSRLQQRASRGDRGARAALGLKENARGLLLTVKAANIFLATIAGFYGGVWLAPGVSRAIGKIAVFAPYDRTIGIGVTVLLISSATLVLGEIVPRRIAAVRPEQVATLVSRPLKVLVLLGQPVLELSTQCN